MLKKDHPRNLLTRLFMLEFIHHFDKDLFYNRSSETHQDLFFYTYTNEKNQELYDFNWEYALFKATMPQLEHLMETMLEEAEVIKKEQDAELKIAVEQQAATDTISGDMMQSINIMDMAKSDITKMKTPSKLLVDGKYQ